MLRQDSTEALVQQNGIRASLRDNGILLKQQLVLDDDHSFLSGLCSSACTQSSQGDGQTLIPYAEILNVKSAPSTVDNDDGADEYEITFAAKVSSQSIYVPRSVVITVDNTMMDQDVVKFVMQKSYSGTSPYKRVMVILNPHGGQGKAIDLFMTRAKPILDAAGCVVDICKTEKYRHAVEIVETMDVSKYDVIACASGDGIPHEVFNGLYRRADRAHALDSIAVTQLPCGSGNAMSESCHGTGEASQAAISLVKSHVVNIDLMAVTQQGKTTVSFLSQTMGVIADADIKTEALRFLGAVRFDIGVAYGVFAGHKYPCELAVKYAAKSKTEVRDYFDRHVAKLDDKTSKITEETLTLKYNADSPIPDDWERLERDFCDNIEVFYTGKMPYISHDVNFFPAALPNDGSFDLIMMDSRTPITRQTPILLSLDSGKHVHAPEVQHAKVLAYRLTPKFTGGLLSIDGERFPFEETQVEVLPGAAKTLMKNGIFRPDRALNEI
ncbi:LCB4 [Cyberlindnera jadinii]|uniref:LCB4 protein n=1 Tax=Cyberlindnera jadinii (strain ATCC 18201 / CBS 1600 / BCRC 20928 / JCM 3617 / NBRC 0987 / NRRL Y-1542) TaxID=983966 RepID=A0A0H5CJ12_CYBJN|nr:LCB4 [Cyberlindnera jadinii]